MKPVTELSFAAAEAVNYLREIGVDVDSTDFDRDTWHSFLLEIDRFTAYGYGAASQHLFMSSPNSALAGRTPAQAAKEPDGIARVTELVREALSRADAALVAA
jgi:hypothetical protein